MSIIDVTLESAIGTPQERVDGSLWLLGDVLSRIAGSADFRVLPQIDMYGDTVFNRLQAGEFLEEWRSLESLCESPGELALVRAVEALAEKCKQTPGYYLKFYGD